MKHRFNYLQMVIQFIFIIKREKMNGSKKLQSELLQRSDSNESHELVVTETFKQEIKDELRL